MLSIYVLIHLFLWHKETKLNHTCPLVTIDTISNVEQVVVWGFLQQRLCQAENKEKFSAGCEMSKPFSNTYRSIFPATLNQQATNVSNGKRSQVTS